MVDGAGEFYQFKQSGAKKLDLGGIMPPPTKLPGFGFNVRDPTSFVGFIRGTRHYSLVVSLLHFIVNNHSGIWSGVP